MGIADNNTRHETETVNYSMEEWVFGDVHTNTIEGVWSHFKRSIIGAFHKVSEKHLDKYLEELEWRPPTVRTAISLLTPSAAL